MYLLVSSKLLWQCPFCCGILAEDSDFQLWQNGSEFLAICNNVDCSLEVSLKTVEVEMSTEQKIFAARKEMQALHATGELKRLAEKKRQRNLADKTVADEFRGLLASRDRFYLPS